MIIVKTPMRVSLFGGGTDYPAYFAEHGGAVLGMAIDKYSWITLRKLPPFFSHRFRVCYSKVEIVREIASIQHPAVRAILTSEFANGGDDGLEITTTTDLPALSGMGSSSAFTVGLLNALGAYNGHIKSPKYLADRAIEMEQDVMKETVGCQDQIFAALGGFRRIDFPRSGHWTSKSLVMTHANRAILTASMVLYYTGLSRFASQIAASQNSRVKVNENRLHTMSEICEEACDSLLDIPRLGKLLTESWELKRTLSPDITNDDIDDLLQAGIKAGAYGGKLLGAGGGGFLLFLINPELRPALSAAMGDRIEINFEMDGEGSRVVLYHPEGL